MAFPKDHGYIRAPLLRHFSASRRGAEDNVKRNPLSYFKNDECDLVEFVGDYLLDSWDLSVITPGYDREAAEITLVVIRK